MLLRQPKWEDSIVHHDGSDDEVVVAPTLEPKVEDEEERILRVLFRENSKPIIEVSSYDGKLDTNALLDWISKMEKFF